MGEGLRQMRVQRAGGMCGMATREGVEVQIWVRIEELRQECRGAEVGEELTPKRVWRVGGMCGMDTREGV